jgi:hypothetical protein
VKRRPALETLEPRQLLASGLLTVHTAVDVNRQPGNQSEPSIAINPADPSNLAEFSNDNAAGLNGMSLTISHDGGATWSSRVFGDGSDGVPTAFSDPTVAFDTFGNMFMSYIDDNFNAVIVLSTDEGKTFKSVFSAGSQDQPKIATGPGNKAGTQSVWMEYLDNNGLIALVGANTTGKGQLGTFISPETAPQEPTGNNFGKLSVGPNGQVVASYQDNIGSGGPATIYTVTDPDGVGPVGLSAPVTVSSTNVGGFDYITVQAARSVDCEVGLAYDNSNGPHRGRLYMVYTDAAAPGFGSAGGGATAAEDNTFILERTSDDDGQTWSAAKRVSDDPGTNSKFFPRVAVDPTTGDVGFSWMDCRLDTGSGPGDTDGIPDDESGAFVTVSTDGGKTFAPSVDASTGPTNPSTAGGDANNTNDLGDYMGLAFYNSKLFPAWIDNSKQLVGNPDPPNLDAATAEVDVANLQIKPVAISATEGLAFTGAVATFSAPSDPSAATISGTIDWGDGSPVTTGTIVSNPAGGYELLGLHTYLEGGSYNVTVSITAQNSGSGSVVSTLTIADAPIQSSGLSVTGKEGVPFQGALATFRDTDLTPQPVSFYNASVAWGDGTTTPGTIVALPSGGFEVDGAHTYGGGNYTAQVSITDGGGASSTASTTFAIADSTLVASGVPISGVEGTNFSGVVANFFDSDPRSLGVTYYKATINWGDGASTAGTITVNPRGGFQVVGSHLYGFGNFPVDIHITDSDVSAADATVTAAIGTAPITGFPLPINSAEGNDFRGVVAQFNDSNSFATAGDFKATINWGDGTSSSGLISFYGDGQFLVAGVHAYPVGSYTPTVTLTEVAAKKGTSVTGIAFVSDAPLSATASPFGATEGQAFQGTVATFTDSNPGGAASDYSATINWGDNTSSAGTIAAATSGPGFVVSGGHTFGLVGSYPVLVLIKDVAGNSLTQANTIATIGDAPVTPGTSTAISASEQTATGVVTVGQFVDANPSGTAGQFSAVVSWGDGTVVPGAVRAVGPPGHFDVVGNHTYASPGTYSVNAVVTTDAGKTLVTQGTATVASLVLPLSGALSPQSDSGVVGDWITNINQPIFVGTARPGSTVTMYAQPVGGTASEVLGKAPANALTGSWTITSLPLADGSYHIFAQAMDASEQPSSALTPLASGTGGPLVIATAGPTVTSLSLDPKTDTLKIAFQGNLAALNTSTLLNPANYQLTLPTRRGVQIFDVSSIALDPAAPGTVDVQFNAGRMRGNYLISIASAGIRDLAGNPMNETRFLNFPATTHQPGDPFLAQINTNGVVASAPTPVVPGAQVLAANQFERFIGRVSRVPRPRIRMHRFH